MILRGLRQVTITPLDAEGKPKSESKTIHLGSDIKLHPKASPITAYLSTLEIH